MPSNAINLRTSVLLVIFSILPVVSLFAADEKTEPPVPIRTIAPEVPESFARAGNPGLVTVSFTVDDKGNVQDATILKSSHSELEEPALKAIRKWRFKPARKDGTAVAMQVALPMKFNIN